MLGQSTSCLQVRGRSPPTHRTTPKTLQLEEPTETWAPSPMPRPHLVTCVRVLKSSERMDRSTSMQPMYWGDRVWSVSRQHPARELVPCTHLYFLSRYPGLFSLPESYSHCPRTFASDVLDAPFLT